MLARIARRPRNQPMWRRCLSRHADRSPPRTPTDVLSDHERLQQHSNLVLADLALASCEDVRIRRVKEAACALPTKVVELVDRYLARRNEYEAPSYLEARVRVDFLNPLFTALGWDVTNIGGLAEHQRDVVTEARIRVGASIKAPDYVLSCPHRPGFRG